MVDKHEVINTALKVCSKCIFDENVASITFDANGVCNYCHQVDLLRESYGTGGPKGAEEFDRILNKVRSSSRRSRYNCIVGVSGGTDSSFMVKLLVDWGLRPLAVHYDNTWNSAIATMNIKQVLKGTGVDLYTHVVSNKEADDIFRAFFRAGVPDLEASTDLGYAYLLRIVAAKYKIKHIFEGHSFIEEGITPLGRNYFDARYIKDIHNKYGDLKMSTYPLMTMSRFVWSILFRRVEIIRPFWYLSYSKSEARRILEDEFGWKYYGGHHLENKMTSFYHRVYLPKKFGIDLRNNTLAAMARNGQMSRAKAWNEYVVPGASTKDIEELFSKRLGLDSDEYERIMQSPGNNWTQFRTYKRRFELLKPFFYICARLNLVPMSFYLKYCFPIKVNS